MFEKGKQTATKNEPCLEALWLSVCLAIFEKKTKNNPPTPDVV